jgi:hypothetical protein
MLWGLLFAFSWLLGVILMSIASRSTKRDLQTTTASARALVAEGPSGTGIRRRFRNAAGVTLVAAGAAAMIGGVVGLAQSVHTELPELAVSTPAAGMVATSVGAGGSQPTKLLQGASGRVGITSSGVVPITPTLFLEPARARDFGVGTSESAYWKVWWDGATQQKDVVSLQQHLDTIDASEGVLSLGDRNNNPAVFDNSSMSFTSVGSFTIPEVPGLIGHVWSGVEDGRLPIEFRFAVFSRGAVVALVSTTSYAGSTSPTAFRALVLSEYAQMANSQTPLGARDAFDFMFGIGLALLLCGVITLIGTRYQPPGLVRAPAPYYASPGYPAYPYPSSSGTGPPIWYPPTAWGAPSVVSPSTTAGAAAETAPNPRSYATDATEASDAKSDQPPGESAPIPAVKSLPHAGWYPDPSGSARGALRYWDGRRWTDAMTSGSTS